MRVLACKASDDYRLWLRFEDGLEGTVFLGNLVELGPFASWRDMRVFLKARVDDDTVMWPVGGVRLDPQILWHDVAARSGRLPAPAVRPALPPAPPRDVAFYRFMAQALERPKRGRKK